MTNTSGSAYPSRTPLSPSKTTVMNSAICKPQSSKQEKGASYLSKGPRPKNMASTSHATLGSQARPIPIDELSSCPPHAIVLQASSRGTLKPSVSSSSHTFNFSSAEFNADSSVRRSSTKHFAIKPTTSGASTLCLLPVPPVPTPTKSEGVAATTAVQGVGDGVAPAVPRVAGKKRLGMGRTTGGYPNKKFKRPT